MWHSHLVLREFEELKRLGFAPKFEQGMRIARGFADLGYEEFYLTNERTMVSILNGKSAPFPESHEHFFFAVLDCDRLLRELAARRLRLVSLQQISARETVASFSCALGGTEWVGRGPTLLQALIAVMKRHLQRDVGEAVSV